MVRGDWVVSAAAVPVAFPMSGRAPEAFRGRAALYDRAGDAPSECANIAAERSRCSDETVSAQMAMWRGEAQERVATIERNHAAAGLPGDVQHAWEEEEEEEEEEEMENEGHAESGEEEDDEEGEARGAEARVSALV